MVLGFIFCDPRDYYQQSGNTRSPACHPLRPDEDDRDRKEKIGCCELEMHPREIGHGTEKSRDDQSSEGAGNEQPGDPPQLAGIFVLNWNLGCWRGQFGRLEWIRNEETVHNTGSPSLEKTV